MNVWTFKQAGIPIQVTRPEADRWNKSWTGKIWMDKVVELVPVWQSPRTLGRTYSRVHHD